MDNISLPEVKDKKDIFIVSAIFIGVILIIGGIIIALYYPTWKETRINGSVVGQNSTLVPTYPNSTATEPTIIEKIIYQISDSGQIGEDGKCVSNVFFNLPKQCECKSGTVYEESVGQFMCETFPI